MSRWPSLERGYVASDKSRFIAKGASPRVWFDASVRPNVSTSEIAFILLTLALGLTVTISAAGMALLSAWPASILAGCEGVAVAAFVFWHAQRFRQQEQRIVLTDTTLSIAYRASIGSPPTIKQLNPAWIRIERQRRTEGECMAAYFRLRNTRIPFGEALTPSERESLANAVELALNERRQPRMLVAAAASLSASK